MSTNEIIHNATIEQEVNTPVVKLQEVQRQSICSNILKWLLIFIAIITTVSNPNALNTLTSIVTTVVPGMVMTVSSLWYSPVNVTEDIKDTYTYIDVDITGFKDSIHEISTFINIDYTPMHQLTTSMTKASRAVSNIKEVATRALSHTNIPQEYDQAILEFFSNLTDEIRATEGSARDANDAYHEHQLKLKEIRHHMLSMKRNINKSNIPGFVKRIDQIIKLIDELVADLRRIKGDFVIHQENIRSYHTQSHSLQNDVLEQSDVAYQKDTADLSIKKGAGAVAVLAAMSVNPIAGVALGLYGWYYAAEEAEKIEAALGEFQRAATMFERTSDVLDGCVAGISVIIDNLSQISANLRQIQRASNMAQFEFGEMNRKNVINDDDKEELIVLIDYVIETIDDSIEKYIYGTNRA